jgi:hypothetical protein
MPYNLGKDRAKEYLNKVNSESQASYPTLITTLYACLIRFRRLSTPSSKLDFS